MYGAVKVAVSAAKIITAVYTIIVTTRACADVLRSGPTRVDQFPQRHKRHY
jgi:hypothetical protein